MPRKIPASPLGDSLIAVAYLRVSTEDQDLGPLAQRHSIEAWASALKVRVVAWHEDRTSGAVKDDEDIDHALGRRTALFAAFQSAREAGAGVIVVAKHDRLGRDPMLVGHLEREARQHGARFVSAAGEGTADDSPGSVLIRGVFDTFAAYERAIIRARTKAALDAKARQGERCGSLPLGWTAPDGVHLVEDAAWTAGRQHAAALRAGGMSLRDVGAALAEMGLRPAARGGKKEPLLVGEGSWSAEQVKRFLAGR